MESSVYNTLGLKINRTYPDKKDETLGIKDFLDNKLIIESENELRKFFTNDLKNILKRDNLFDLIQGFFDLEQDLSHAFDRLDFEATIVNFDEFYKNLSPVLMRALLENSAEPDNASAILKSIKEALRIAYEEELYQLESHES